MTAQAQKKNIRITLLGVLALLGGMIALSAAAVPLYDIFCDITGYGGTPQVNTSEEQMALGKREMTVQFNANVNQKLPWDFKPEQREITGLTGKRELAFYRAENRSDHPITGVATFNVTPAKAGQYFQKVQCFCFNEQTLAPGERADMPVSYYVDPAIEDDPHMDDVHTITLSYTFFEATP